MNTQPITLDLPSIIVRKIELLAAQRNTSVTNLVAQAVEQLVQREDAYNVARKRHLQWLAQGADLGTGGRISIDRDKLHERE